ncbi:MAG TPA: putative Ig domain-containing protein [Chthoniobacterales bacterium]|nr:putative Ig domain-containing protein [Chthoniobacterales bacterium]
MIAAARAQAPVITNPGNLRELNVNIAISPLQRDPEWRAMAPMPTARAGFATAAAGGKIYAIAGAVVDHCNPIATVEAYDPRKDLWTTDLAPLPSPLRFRPSASTLDRLIYVVAGVADGCPGRALDTAQAYDPATDTWADKQHLNVARIQVGLGADGAHHLLYAVGGANPDFTALDTVEVYNPAPDSWTLKQHLNTPRAFPAVAAVNGKIYAVGGQKENHGVINTVEEFDPNANGGFGAWTTKPSVMPHPRLHSAAAVVDGKIHVIGGEDNDLVSGIDVYDPILDVWTTETPMPTARRLLGAAVVGDSIYAVGGESLVARVGQPFVYQITATNNPTEYDAFPLPEGLNVDTARGIIFGTPTRASEGFTITFAARNSSGSDSKDVSLFIARPQPASPEVDGILAGTAVTARAGEPFAFQVLRKNASLEATIMATGLPYESGVGGGPQLTLDPGTGFITGTVPLALDGFARSFGLQLGLANADPAQSYLQLTFVSDPSLPVITSGSKAALVLNKFFSYTITADARTASFDYLGLDGVLDGALPSGLSFDASTGTISGVYNGQTSLSSRPLKNKIGRWQDRESIEKGIDAIETIKKEPPPRIQLFAMGDTGDTGTTPLDFIVGLHDFEAEVLSSTTSEETDYALFTNDPLASAGGAGLLEASKVGDFVTYTVSMTRSGSYQVMVGTRTGESAGIFQLAIDGANQGSPQDEYAGTTAYESRDLGPVTFPSAGDKAFRFSITGHNPSSNGYEFVCDYLDLVPNLEAEGLFVQEHSAPYVKIRDSALSGGAGIRFKANKVGDDITFTVPIADAGTYNLIVKTKPAGGAAGFELFVDGVKQGYAQRAEKSDANGRHNLGTIEFESAGDKAFQFLITESAPHGGGYDVVFDDIQLVLATSREAEALAVKADDLVVRIDDENLSGQAGILFDPATAGSAVSYKITVPIAGTYSVRPGIRTGDHGGIVQLSIDGVDLGTAQDTYAPMIGYRNLALGRVTFTEAGEKTFRFEVAGQNSKSNGLEFLLDYIDLVR